MNVSRLRSIAAHASAFVMVVALAACGGGGGGGGSTAAPGAASSPSPAANVPPVVSLASAATATVGTAITLTATATDSDDTVTKVEFLDGIAVLATDTTLPYSFAWTPATAATHSLTARATDSRGGVTTSAAVSVVVVSAPAPPVDSTPPTATITSPLNLATGLTGVVAVTVSSADNVLVTEIHYNIDGGITTVDFGMVTPTVTFPIDTSQYTAGQHVLRVRARDAAGNFSAWQTVTLNFGGTTTQPAGFTRNESFVTGLTAATAFAQAADGRFFVAQQGGALRVVKAGVLLPSPFATVSVDATGERGLIGVALHPSFATNGWVYIYSTRSVGGASHNRISRFTASGDVAAAGSEVVIVDLPNLSSATNHNGGGMHFGADGKLYVGVGDNANGAQAQNLDLPFGKLLRFNDDGSIPTDNPFAANARTVLGGAVWAYGLRNPYTFAVQPGTGAIHINDVGENTWEEINVGAAGGNYGWPASEGPDNITTGVTAPLFTYKHSDAVPLGSGPGGFLKGFAIAGGSFYPATGPFPDGYRNSYYFADYVNQFVGRLDTADGNLASTFAKLSGSPVDLLVSIDGALIVLTRSGLTKISAP